MIEVLDSMMGWESCPEFRQCNEKAPLWISMEILAELKISVCIFTEPSKLDYHFPGGGASIVLSGYMPTKPPAEVFVIGRHCVAGPGNKTSMVVMVENWFGADWESLRFPSLIRPDQG